MFAQAAQKDAETDKAFGKDTGGILARAGSEGKSSVSLKQLSDSEGG